MAYSELIKNFDRIRDYMRQFYVYGFKSRTEYDKKSARSYDNALLRGDGKSVAVNTAVTVLWDGGDFYVVDINGEICNMASSQIGTGKFSTGGGGDSGGDWTPPAL